MTRQRHTVDSITDDDLDDLYENANEGWRRGDRWKARAEMAEGALERLHAVLAHYSWEHAQVPVRHVLDALAEPKENSTP